MLCPLLKNDVPRQFSDDPESMVFHRDIGSGHIARETIQYLKNNNVNFTDKEEWLPKPQELPRWIPVCGEFSSAFTKNGTSTLSLVILTRLKGCMEQT